MNLRKSLFIKHVIAIAILLLLSGGVETAITQPVMLVKNISPGVGDSAPSFLTDVNGTLFFTTLDNALWKSDETVNGTIEVKQFQNPSAVLILRETINGTLYFRVDDGISGDELWKSNGTTNGTELVADINPGPGSSVPDWMTNVNGTLFFKADDGTNGVELWKSDGTTAGTVLVKDINPGAGSSAPSHLANFDGTLFFSADDGTNGRELWKSDGTAAGTVLVKDIYPGAIDSGPARMMVVNNILFFSAQSPDIGTELWKSDGTAAGTVLVKDINPGNADSSPYLFANVNETLFFRADNDAFGEEVWKSDGTTPGTVLVRDINPGSADSFPLELTSVNGTLFFTADDGVNCFGVWKSDGTSSGTVLVKDIWPGPCNLNPLIPGEFTDVGGILYFAGHAPTTGNELWKSDGTTAGTVLVEDINPGSGPNQHSNPTWLTDVNGTLLFAARDNIVGQELWAAQSPVTFSLIPNNPPIQIPPTGGSFQFDVDLTNISGATQELDFWTHVNLPSGGTTDPLFGPVALELAPGQTIATGLTQNVPPVDPNTFTYVGNVGIFPDSILVSDSFSFSVTTSPNLAKASQSESTGDWSVHETGTQPQTLTNSVPEEFALEQNYPNPFNPTTTISYQLPQTERVKITIYDLTGRKVRELLNEVQNAGSHQIRWDGTDGHNQNVASGLYLYRIQAGKFVQTRKMALIK